ncbi:MAG TPA: tetratricopeptide repeat protein, partial [Pirellulales bacterium]
DLTESIRLDPKAARGFSNRGNVYAATGQLDKAIDDYTDALRLDPNLQMTYSNRGNAFDLLGQHKKAIADFDHAIQLDGQDSEAWRYKAWILATSPDGSIRDGKTAIECAKKAYDLTRGGDPLCIEALAAAYAEVNDFPAAVKWQEQAVSSGSPDREGAAERLALYQASRPYRSSPAKP